MSYDPANRHGKAKGLFQNGHSEENNRTRKSVCKSKRRDVVFIDE